MKKIRCATYEGFDAQTVDVESTLTKGLPSFSIVGMANTAITESKERVKSALLSNHFTFPPKRITINLSPSDLAKSGSQFDLAIALLIALDHTDVSLQEWFAFGELGLDGSVKENQLLYPLILSLANRNLMQKAIVPAQSIEKLRHIPGIAFYGVSDLDAALELLKTPESVQPTLHSTLPDHPSVCIEDTDYYIDQTYALDFSDVKGQEVAKRAALVSAAGMHNLLLEGSPGSGKSMIAKRLHYILPPVKQQELLEIAKLESLEGNDPTFTPLRPFRSPHHSSTPASIFGGGCHLQ
jgi:magnesium chelatase family protein